MAAVRDEMGDETASSSGEPGTGEAEALAAALNHSAERVQTLWFSFLAFMLYLAIAAGTTTHRMLFLESPLNLPVLNISLPLLGFYILAPVIFVVFHFYLLLNLVLLARTAKSFEDSLSRAFPEDTGARENFRMRIENTLFVQLLVGGRLEREGINAKLLSLMALITLALAPIALLLFLEIKFLPHHSERITWFHRGLLALDLLLMWTLWPGYRSGWGVRLWPKRSWRLALPGALSAAAVVYAVLVVTFPDERIYLATDWLRESLVGANTRARIAPINTLDLHGEDLIDDAKLAHIIEKNESLTGGNRWVVSLTLAKRDLTGANFSDVDVRHVDFSHAILNRANFAFAWAENAHFQSAQLHGASLADAQLQGANLDFAHLQGASLDFAHLQGASLDGAQLQGASLKNAQLQGASLNGAQLQGASVHGAQLHGASLIEGQFQAAKLDFAHLQGASLYAAQLQGASLVGAHLQSALLDSAYLQGASLDFTHLQGASLGRAELQGASLDRAELQSASLVNVFVWRAAAQTADWENTRITDPETGRKCVCFENWGQFGDVPICAWTADTFEELRKRIAEQVPEGEHRRKAMERIERTLDPTKSLEGEEEMAKVWAARVSTFPTPEAYERSLAEQWRKTGCDAEGAPYVLRALLHRLDDPETSPFGADSPEKAKLAAAFLDKVCAGARGLLDAEIAKLKEIAAKAPPPAPKP